MFTHFHQINYDEHLECGATERFPDLGNLKFAMVVWLSQFLLLPQLPQKMTLASKLVKNDSKIVILLPLAKSVTHSVEIYLWIQATYIKPRFLISNQGNKHTGLS